MNLEGLTLHLVTEHLKQELEGSKIYRVFMPNGHSLLLNIRRDRDTTSLLADMNGGSPALYIPQTQPENPEIPPAFCMLLRKHLEEGRITQIYQKELDRVIVLEIDMLGAGSKIITKQLIFELAGKNSNILLVQDGVIIDSLKHVNALQSSYRLILPGKEYVAPPPQQGFNLLTDAPERLVEELCQAPATTTVLKALIASTLGMGKVSCSELLAKAGISLKATSIEAEELERLLSAVKELQQRLTKDMSSTGVSVSGPVSSGNHSAGKTEALGSAAAPVYALISRTNTVKTILPQPPLLLEEGMQVQEFPDINSAICYAVGLVPIQLPQQELLQKLVLTEKQKITKKLVALEGDLDKALEAEKERMLADTLMANIYQLKKGMTQATLINIYDGEEITLKLSPILSPSENAQAYYKKYNKLKRAQTEVQNQLEAAEELQLYLGSLEASLLTATTKNEIEEIRQEMLAAGILKEVSKKKKFNLPKSQPLHIKLNDNADIFIGKNNKQNDFVTFSLASVRDLWFHTKNIPGSHVLLKTNLGEPAEEDILVAVKLAAYFSQARNSSQVPVDCVPKRYVKKPSGAKPGFVIFTNQTTYYTTPVAAEIEALLK